jgi:hypothetical protein
MQIWARLGDNCLIGRFKTNELAILRSHIEELLGLIDARLVSDVPASPPDQARTDVRLQEILRFRTSQTTQEALRWKEMDLLKTSQTMLESMLIRIPQKGDVVRLVTFDYAFAWMWALTDLKVALTSRTKSPPKIDRTECDLAYVEWIQSVGDSLYSAITTPSRAQTTD